MMILAVITVGAVVYGVLSGHYERALAIGAVTPAGAAIAAGGEALPTFYATALGGLGLLVWQWIARGGKPGTPRLGQIPGVSLLLAMLAWSALVVVIAPLLFPGTVSVTEAQWVLVPGVINSSNIAQLAYLGLGIAIIVLLARSPSLAPTVLAIPIAGSIGLSFWRYLSLNAGVPYPEGVFDNSPSFHYIETAAGGVERFRGIFAEPAGLAVSSVVAVAYGVSLAAHVKGLKRAACLLLVGISIFLGIVSTSTTFLVAGAIMAALGLVVVVWRLATLRLRVSSRAVVVSLAVVAGAVLALPALLGMLAAEVESKVGTSSFNDRSDNDGRAFAVFLDSWGLGIGVGSVRASSFAYTLLGATGLVGVILFVLALIAIVLPALRIPRCAPVLWALVASLVVKVISSPDLGDSSGILWMCLGILAHGVVHQRASANDAAVTRAAQVPVTTWSTRAINP